MGIEQESGRIIAGRYRLGQVLGRGAHGVVHVAEDLGRGGTRVALKLVEGVVGGGGSFEPAAQALLWFRHPRWAQVLDFGRSGTQDWFQATRYVPGTSLDKVDGPQPIPHVWKLLEDGARVLQALHQQGLIHYDVTPGNVLREDGGDPPDFILTDGGLAHDGPVLGVARGSPLYMAPEVTEARAHDHRVDLYSLGLVAFRLATGRDPFEGGAGEVLGRRRREVAPRASTLLEGIPNELDGLLASLLARDPSDRPGDARALLTRIAEATGRAVSEALPEEAFAAASGGRMVNRDEALARLKRTTTVLAEMLPPTDAPEARTPVALPDPVLVLSGPQGVGATRTAREFAATARGAELPVLLLAGRDGAPDPNRPLDGLLTGLRALGADPVARARRSRARSRDEREHSEERQIEQLIAEVVATARRTPVTIVVEDFAQLPGSARRAVCVLSRFLLARTEHNQGVNPPPVLLVVDAGAEDTTPLLIADAEEPRRPVVTLEPFGPDEALQLCSARFEHLLLSERDLEAFLRLSGGLPSRIVALLSEAVRRGDLQRYEGAWRWSAGELESYETTAVAVDPVHEDALRRSDPRIRQYVTLLALLDEPVPLALATTLAQGAGLAARPTTPLVTDGEAHVSVASLAVRQRLLTELADEARAASEALAWATLRAADDPRTALDTARLATTTGNPREALEALARHAGTFTSRGRQRMQGRIHEALEADPSLAADGSLRSSVTHLMERGPHAPAIAGFLAPHFANDGTDLDDVCLVAKLIQAGAPEDAARLLRTHVHADVGPAVSRALAEVMLARLLLREKALEEASTLLDRAEQRLQASGDAPARVRALYETARAQAASLRQDRQRALDHLQRALAAARESRDRVLLALAYNNLGVATASSGAYEAGKRHLERSLRLKRALGDVTGTVISNYNLARILEKQGELGRSITLGWESAQVALRHDLVDYLIQALRHLAQGYDRQHRPTLALRTLSRAIRTRGCPQSSRAEAAWALAPLAASLGAKAAEREALALSDAYASGAATGRPRAMHQLVCALCALHSGLLDLAALRLKEASANAEHLLPEERRPLWLLGALPSLRLPGCEAPRRPARGDPERALYRYAVRLRMATRGPVALRLPSLWPRQGGTLTPFHGGEVGRIGLELVLGAVRDFQDPGAERQLADALPTLRSHQATPLYARVLAMLSRSDLPEHRKRRVHHFSEAVSSWPEAPGGSRAPGLPAELLAAAEAMRTTLSVAPDARGTESSDTLHALAHKALVSQHAVAAPDNRLASALRRVLELSAQMRGEGGLEALLQSTTRDAIEITGAQRACVVFFDGPSGMRISGSHNQDPMAGAVDVEDLSHTVIQRVCDSHAPQLLHDVYDDAELMGRRSITDLALRSILCVPMLRNERLYGVLYADSTSAVAAFDRVDLEVLSLFAEQAAAALESRRLLEDVQRSYRELQALQERLVRAERLRVMGELSSGVAHEFNNLLTAILARIQMMGLSDLEPDVRKHLELVEKAALDAAEVVRRLQTFSRQERQKDFARVDMAEVCADAVDLLRPLWRGRSVRGAVSVQLHTEPDLYVRGDPTELREVLTNVLKNAIDAVADSGRIVVSAGRRSGRAVVKVTDTGPGIPEDVVARVFDPFFTTKGERGTGLGLCLSQQILERHGGGIALESREGVGTTVNIRVPLTGPAHEGPATGAAHAPEEKRSLRVVVVDDDVDVLTPLCDYLTKSGYAVTSASNGEEGLRVVERHTPDVVLTDIGMPGMDGIELCRLLNARHPAVPIVLMSGWASDVDPVRAREAGARALLAKPFAMQQVMKLLGSVTQRPQQL